jgi:hypothetical protein
MCRGIYMKTRMLWIAFFVAFSTFLLTSCALIEYETYPLQSFDGYSGDVCYLRFIKNGVLETKACYFRDMYAELGKNPKRTEVRFCIRNGEFESCIILCPNEDSLKIWRLFIEKHRPYAPIINLVPPTSL